VQLGGAMGSKEEIGLKRGFPRGILLPAVALSLTLLLGPSVGSWADNPQPAGDSASAAGNGDDQGDASIRKIIGDAETPDIQHDPRWKVASDDSGYDTHGDAQDKASTRKTIDQSETPDIQHDPPAEKPAPAPPPSLPLIALSFAWLPYAILILIAAGLLFLAARYIRYRSGLNAADQDRPAAEPGTSTYTLAADERERDHTFDEVDALAAQGAFAEAIHRLLLLVQERLRSRLEHGFQTSLTSREILRRAKLPGDAKTAFGSLVAAVEITLFGQQAANLATYQLCRESSQRVLAAV